jgi:segregation and condensation protein A
MGRVPVRDLDLDLEAFEGPFDLLLTLVLKEELPLADVEVVEIVLAFVERLAAESRLDVEAAGEFLVLVAALLDLKARELFAEEDDGLDDLDAEEAAAELAARLAEFRRIKAGADWLEERLAAEADRYFRLGPPPLAPCPERPLARQDPDGLAAALRELAAEPPAPSLAHLALRLPPLERFLERFRALVRARASFGFDEEVDGLSRVELAVAFIALLELRKSGEVRISQAEPFAPILVTTAATAAAQPPSALLSAGGEAG